MGVWGMKPLLGRPSGAFALMLATGTHVVGTAQAENAGIHW